MNTRLVLRTFVVTVALLFLVDGAEAQIQYYVLDGFGGVHAGNGAPAISPATPYFGFDIAADVAYVPGFTGDGVLVLDGFGGVHVGGALVGASHLIRRTSASGWRRRSPTGMSRRALVRAYDSTAPRTSN